MQVGREGEAAMLPEFDRVLFRKAPLQLVVAQVRFPLLTRFGEGGFIAPFHEALRDEYPRASREQQMAFQLSPRGLEPTAGDTLWRLTSRDERWAVVLGEAALTLEVRGYSSIDDLLARFQRILTAARDTLGVVERARIGLRYVNELHHPRARTLEDWIMLLRAELIGFAPTRLLDGHVEHMLHEVRLRRADGTLAIRHGLLSDSTGESTSTDETERYYLLDFDYYDVGEEDLDVPAVVTRMRAYNDLMYRLFRWTLSQQLYEYLEPEHVG
jgi:uncharacterized protein (TIGR04255 family)